MGDGGLDVGLKIRMDQGQDEGVDGRRKRFVGRIVLMDGWMKRHVLCLLSTI